MIAWFVKKIKNEKQYEKLMPYNIYLILLNYFELVTTLSGVLASNAWKGKAN